MTRDVGHKYGVVSTQATEELELYAVVMPRDGRHGGVTHTAEGVGVRGGGVDIKWP